MLVILSVPPCVIEIVAALIGTGVTLTGTGPGIHRIPGPVTFVRFYLFAQFGSFEYLM